MTIDMSQFYEVFFDEAEELLAEKERLLLALDPAAPSLEDLNAVFRAAHSIKGGAATFGFTDLTEVTHILESLLDKLRNNEIELHAEMVDAFLDAKDVLKGLLDARRLGTEADHGEVARVCASLQAFARGGTPAVAGGGIPDATEDVSVAKAEPVAPTAATPESPQRYRIALRGVGDRDLAALLTELAHLGELKKHDDGHGNLTLELTTTCSRDDLVVICCFVVDADQLVVDQESADHQTTTASQPAAQSPAPAEDDPGHGFFTELHAALGLSEPSPTLRAGRRAGDDPDKPVVRVGRRISDDPDKPVVTFGRRASDDPDKPVVRFGRRESDKIAAAPQQESSSIRVGIEKVDQLINMVGELVITQAMLAQATARVDPMPPQQLLNGMAQLERNTRDLQEAVMSIRMIPMDYVFSRFPRVVRDLAGKLNKQVELKTVGESTELDKGLVEKIIDPLTHLIRNSLDHGIEAPDTRVAAGKPAKGTITLRAFHQGGNIIIEVQDDGAGLNRDRILTKARERGMLIGEAMSDQEVWQLIFEAGFSTAEAITDVSGRGVGMDVVKRNITALGGNVEIRSEPGLGTTMHISLPLTLAILDGMSIRVGDEIYILPLGVVIESLQPKPADVKSIAGHSRAVKVRDDYLPLLPLYRIFGIEPRVTEPTKGIVVIIETEGKKAALLVDELVGQQQVVVKNLESNYRKVAGISGATILGDGSVALILDAAALIRSCRQLSLETALV